MSKAKKKHLHGQGSLVRSQFRSHTKIPERTPDIDRRFKEAGLVQVKFALKTALEWVKRRETTWALVQARKAVQVLEAIDR